MSAIPKLRQWSILSGQEIAERRYAAENALASQRIEGLEPEPWAVVQMDSVIAGEIEIGDVIESFIGRIKHGEVRG